MLSEILACYDSVEAANMVYNSFCLEPLMQTVVSTSFVVRLGSILYNSELRFQIQKPNSEERAR